MNALKHGVIPDTKKINKVVMIPVQFRCDQLSIKARDKGCRGESDGQKNEL